jgi:hypothetical protein
MVRRSSVAAPTAHALLFLFPMIAPVSGLLATNAHRFPLNWFGLVPIGSLIEKMLNVTWSAQIRLGLFAMHLGAMLLHHVIKRDDTHYRILSWLHVPAITAFETLLALMPSPDWRLEAEIISAMGPQADCPLLPWTKEADNLPGNYCINLAV